LQQSPADLHLSAALPGSGFTIHCNCARWSAACLPAGWRVRFLPPSRKSTGRPTRS